MWETCGECWAKPITSICNAVIDTLRGKPDSLEHLFFYDLRIYLSFPTDSQPTFAQTTPSVFPNANSVITPYLLWQLFNIRFINLSYCLSACIPPSPPEVPPFPSHPSCATWSPTSLSSSLNPFSPSLHHHLISHHSPILATWSPTNPLSAASPTLSHHPLL